MRVKTQMYEGRDVKCREKRTEGKERGGREERGEERR